MTQTIRMQGSRRRGRVLRWLSVGGVIFVVVAGIAAIVGIQRYLAISKAHDWLIAGPPCPSLSPAGYLASGARIAHTISYDNVGFGPGYGSVSCDQVAGHGGWGPDIVPVCQFNNPTVLEVTTTRGDFYFFTQVQAATVSIVDQRPRCVMNSSIGDRAVEQANR